MANEWDEIRRLQGGPRIPQGVPGHRRALINVDEAGTLGTTLEASVLLLADVLAHVSYDCVRGPLLTSLTELPYPLGDYDLLVLFAEKPETLQRQQAVCSVCLPRELPVVVLTSQVRTTSPASAHVSVCGAACVVVHPTGPQISLVPCFLRTVAVMLTNGIVVTAGGVVCHSDGCLGLCGVSAETTAHEAPWGEFGRDVVLGCDVSCRADRTLFPDRLTVGGLLKLLLPQARIQSAPSETVQLIVILGGTDRAPDVSLFLRELQVRLPKNCSVDVLPRSCSRSGTAVVEAVLRMPQALLPDAMNGVYRGLEAQILLADVHTETRVSYSFEVLVPFLEFVLLKQLSHSRSQDDYLRICIEAVGNWHFVLRPVDEEGTVLSSGGSFAPTGRSERAEPAEVRPRRQLDAEKGVAGVGEVTEDQLRTDVVRVVNDHMRRLVGDSTWKRELAELVSQSMTEQREKGSKSPESGQHPPPGPLEAYSPEGVGRERRLEDLTSMVQSAFVYYSCRVENLERSARTWDEYGRGRLEELERQVHAARAKIDEVESVAAKAAASAAKVENICHRVADRVSLLEETVQVLHMRRKSPAPLTSPRSSLTAQGVATPREQVVLRVRDELFAELRALEGRVAQLEDPPSQRDWRTEIRSLASRLSALEVSVEMFLGREGNDGGNGSVMVPGGKEGVPNASTTSINDILRRLAKAEEALRSPRVLPARAVAVEGQLLATASTEGGSWTTDVLSQLADLTARVLELLDDVNSVKVRMDLSDVDKWRSRVAQLEGELSTRMASLWKKIVRLDSLLGGEPCREGPKGMAPCGPVADVDAAELAPLFSATSERLQPAAVQWRVVEAATQEATAQTTVFYDSVRSSLTAMHADIVALQEKDGIREREVERLRDVMEEFRNGINEEVRQTKQLALENCERVADNVNDRLEKVMLALQVHGEGQLDALKRELRRPSPQRTTVAALKAAPRGTGDLVQREVTAATPQDSNSKLAQLLESIEQQLAIKQSRRVTGARSIPSPSTD